MELALLQGKRKADADLYFSEVYRGPDPGAVVGELDPGIEYQFRVYTVNSQGSSIPSATCAP